MKQNTHKLCTVPFNKNPQRIYSNHVLSYSTFWITFILNFVEFMKKKNDKQQQCICTYIVVGRLG